MGARLRPRSAASWATSEPEPRRWIVPGFVPAGCVTLLSGEGGIGKSALAIGLALAVSTGTQWLGQRVMTGAVLAIFAEDDAEEVGRRLRRIAGVEGADLGVASDLVYLAADDLPNGAALAITTDNRLTLTETFREVEAIVATSRPALIILDPAAEIAAIDENRRSEVAAFLRALGGLAASSGAGVVLISHPSIAGMASGSGLSGSTAWNNSVRQRLVLESVKDDRSRRRLTVAKSNYGSAGHSLDLRVVDGAFVLDGESGTQREADDKIDAIFLDILRRLTAERRPLSAAASANYAPTVMKKEPEANGIDKAGLQAAMSRLFKAGRLVVEEEGPPSKRRQRIVERPTNALPTPFEPASDANPEGASNAPSIPPTNALRTPSNAPSLLPPNTPLAVGRVREVGSDASSNQPTDRGSEGRLEPAPEEDGEEPPFADDWSSAWSGSDDEPVGWRDAAA